MQKYKKKINIVENYNANFIMTFICVLWYHYDFCLVKFKPFYHHPILHLICMYTIVYRYKNKYMYNFSLLPVTILIRFNGFIHHTHTTQTERMMINVLCDIPLTQNMINLWTEAMTYILLCSFNDKNHIKCVIWYLLIHIIIIIISAMNRRGWWYRILLMRK